MDGFVAKGNKKRQDSAPGSGSNWCHLEEITEHEWNCHMSLKRKSINFKAKRKGCTFHIFIVHNICTFTFELMVERRQLFSLCSFVAFLRHTINWDFLSWVPSILWKVWFEGAFVPLMWNILAVFYSFMHFNFIFSKFSIMVSLLQ